MIRMASFENVFYNLKTVAEKESRADMIKSLASFEIYIEVFDSFLYEGNEL